MQSPVPPPRSQTRTVSPTFRVPTISFAKACASASGSLRNPKCGKASRTVGVTDDQGPRRSRIYSLLGEVIAHGRNSENDVGGHERDGYSHCFVDLALGWHLLLVNGVLPQLGEVVGSDLNGRF